MADKKITQLSELTTVTNNDYVVVVDDTTGTTYKVKAINAVPDAAIGTSELADGSITSAKLSTSAGNVGGPWTAWTPTLTNLSGGTITVAKYMQVGKTVTLRFKYTLGGAGVSGVPRFTLPVNLAAGYSPSDTVMATGQLNDATGARWFPLVLVASSTALDLYYLNSSPTLASISSSAPFVWAITDFIDLTCVYEAA